MASSDKSDMEVDSENIEHEFASENASTKNKERDYWTTVTAISMVFIQVMSPGPKN